MRNQMTALRQPPAVEPVFRPSEEQNAQSLAVEFPSQELSAYAGDRTAAQLGRPARRILVPTDFSTISDSAIERSVALAWQCDAILTILHVIDITPPAISSHYGSADELMRRLWLTGTAELARLNSSLQEKHVRIRTMLAEGLPSEEIIENSPNFDLLVICEPPSGPGWKLFAKHTARRVIAHAKCPVHVVRGERSLARRRAQSSAEVAA